MRGDAKTLHASAQMRTHPGGVARLASGLACVVVAVVLGVRSFMQIRPAAFSVEAAFPSLHGAFDSSPATGARLPESANFHFHDPLSPVTLITYATSDTPSLRRFTALLRSYGYSYVVLGIGHTFKGWVDRMRAYREAAAAIVASSGRGSWVLLVDAYDNIPLRPAASLASGLALLSGVEEVLLAGSNRECWSNCEPLGAEWWAAQRFLGESVAEGALPSSPLPIPPNQFVDAGNILARAGTAVDFYAWAERFFPADDQVALSRYLRANPSRSLTLDVRGCVFSNVAAGLPLPAVTTLTGGAGGVGDASTGSAATADPGTVLCCGGSPTGGAPAAATPFFLHFPYQASEDGVNAALRDVTAGVAGLRVGTPERTDAAREAVERWPALRTQLLGAFDAAVWARRRLFVIAALVLCGGAALALPGLVAVAAAFRSSCRCCRFGAVGAGAGASLSAAAGWA